MRFSFIFILFITAILMTGCIGPSPDADFYTLNSLTSVPDGNIRDPLRDDLSVGLKLSDLPKMIDRPNIVTRVSDNKVEVSEFHRWAGSLDEDFMRVLTENLSLLLNSTRVFSYPWQEYVRPEYRVYIKIIQIDGMAGKEATIKVKWTITDKEGMKPAVIKKFIGNEPLLDSSYETFVSALSKLSADLSYEIGEEILRLQ